MPFDLDGFLQSRARLIDARLACYLDREASTPSRLQDAIRYCVLGRGKRLRPILVLTAAELIAGEVEPAAPAACAVEMVHTYSLVHDDLPAMDDDDMRRGRPACHKQFDEATAILVGDALLALAFEVLANDVWPEAAAIACVRELAAAAGAAGMVGGQADDLAWQSRAGGTLDDLVNLHHRKTGALFRAALRMGAIIGSHGRAAEARMPIEEALDCYAEHFGLAFQISDDLLDVEGSVSRTGKKVGKDADRGKLTYPGLLGPEGARKRLDECCDLALKAIKGLGPAAEPLVALVEFLRWRKR